MVDLLLALIHIVIFFSIPDLSSKEKEIIRISCSLRMG